MNGNVRDLLTEFAREQVEYLVVGAYAVAAHGVPRATGDFDVWINPTPENARRAWNALARFGAPLGELTPSGLASADVVYQIGVVPDRIDVLTSIDGVEFAAAWSRRLARTVAGIEASVIGREDLLANKRATGRTQDLADAERIAQLPPIA